MPTSQRTTIIASRIGLHARPASIFVQAVNATGHVVTMTKSTGETADAGSILSVLAMGVGHGEQVVLDVSGDNADAVAAELAALLETDLETDL